MRCRGTFIARIAQVALAALLARACVPSPQDAFAVTLGGKFTVAPVPNTTGQPTTYTIDSFRVANKETVTGFTFTFPSDTDASAATLASPAGTMIVAADCRTVTVTLAAPVTGPANLLIVINNVRNPLTAGTYSIPSFTFQRQAATPQTVVTSGAVYTIVPVPYISLTIVTPDDPGLLVDFGTIDPGVSTTARQVTVNVTSNAAYTITRTISGSFNELGLSITGTAAGAKSAGTASWVDDYMLAPPWTTDPDVPLTANVVYTVAQ